MVPLWFFCAHSPLSCFAGCGDGFAQGRLKLKRVSTGGYVAKGDTRDTGSLGISCMEEVQALRRTAFAENVTGISSQSGEHYLEKASSFQVNSETVRSWSQRMSESKKIRAVDIYRTLTLQFCTHFLLLKSLQYYSIVIYQCILRVFYLNLSEMVLSCQQPLRRSFLRTTICKSAWYVSTPSLHLFLALCPQSWTGSVQCVVRIGKIWKHWSDQSIDFWLLCRKFLTYLGYSFVQAFTLACPSESHQLFPQGVAWKGWPASNK